MKQSLLGLDIGGTKCAVIYGETEGDKLTIIGKTGFPTETNRGLNHTLETIFRNIDLVIDKYNLSPKIIEAVGISCGGPLDSKTGTVMSPPNLPGWDNVPLVSLINSRYGIPAAIQNDANACALAEWKFGAGKGTDNMIFMTFGTGMGAGLILNGRLYAGTNDMAGEVGHIRLAETGPVGYCKSYEELNNITAQIIAEAAMNGDELALRIYRTSGEYLGRGLSILIDILNPQVIVIGSIFTRSKGLLEPFAMEIIKKEALSHSRNVCRIVPAVLGEDLGDYAALSVAADHLRQQA
jgi:glucokinase